MDYVTVKKSDWERGKWTTLVERRVSRKYPTSLSEVYTGTKNNAFIIARAFKKVGYKYIDYGDLQVQWRIHSSPFAD